jgi:pimeloyl-ACP methyl ester carboxylesterase
MAFDMQRFKHKSLCFTFFLFSTLLYSQSPIPNQQKGEILQRDNQQIADYSQRMQQFYELEPTEQWRDITEKVLLSPDTPEESKERIRGCQRRIIAFKYPSDGLWIKGFISFTPNPTHHPLLILYRWGNENFALMNPGVIYATYGNYTVVSSTLRGGVSEGKDEFGGADVNDMKNLMDYLPTLARQLGIELHPSCIFMLGPSRGGLEMFLTLARFPELQNRVNKVVALSAALDLHHLIQERPYDMKKMFQTHFGLQEGPKGEAWIAKRDPLNTVPYIKKSLPILIIQGTADNRISLEEGHRMTQQLRRHGNEVDYWEVPKGNHVLLNTPQIMNDIAHWLESNSPCMSVHMPRKKS